MFSSPAIRPYTQQENTNVLMAKKVGNSTLSRKPFADRSVNGKTPEIKQPLKPKIRLTSDSSCPPVVKENNISFYEDFCSYKDVQDDYEDILPKNQRLNIKNILSAFCGRRDVVTPPPQHIMDDFDSMFVELPDKSFDTPIKPVFVEDSFEVSLPDIDFEE